MSDARLHAHTSTDNANTLIHPVANLERTAYDLAYCLKYMKDETLNQITLSVEAAYSAPAKSWVWGWVYSWTRTRGPEILEKVKQNEVLQIIEDDHGSWHENSFNTNFLRALVKELISYDKSVHITSDNIILLKKLLDEAIKKRIAVETKLSEAEKKLMEINDKTGVKEKELIHKQEELLQKQVELIEHEQKLELLYQQGSSQIEEIEHEKSKKKIEIECFKDKIRYLELEKIEKTNQLQQLDEERLKRDAELEEKRKMLILLNPTIDINKISAVELGEIMDQAKKYGEAAVKFFIADYAEQKKRLDERKLIEERRALARIAKPKEQSNEPKIESEEEKAQKEAIEQEKLKKLASVKANCQQSLASKNASFKTALNSQLNLILLHKSKQDERAKVKVSEIVLPEDQRKKDLYTDGAHVGDKNQKALVEAAKMLEAERLKALEEKEKLEQAKKKISFKNMKIKTRGKDDPAAKHLLGLFGGTPEVAKSKPEIKPGNANVAGIK